MRRKYKSLFGSGRSRIFREQASRPVKFRPQKVRFRKRYASSMAMELGVRLWTMSKLALIIGIPGVILIQGRQFWMSSNLLRVIDVQFVQAPPKELPTFLSIKPGENIFKVKTTQLEAASLAKFRELQSISIERTFTRNIAVDIEYRKPMAIIDLPNKKFGVDASGVVFPLTASNVSEKSPPELVGFTAGPELSATMAGLSTIFHELPDFYSLIKFIKTDRMQPLRIVLENGGVIYWGEMNADTVAERTKKVLQILRQYEPVKPLASIRFVTDDRLIMDSQWKAKK